MSSPFSYYFPQILSYDEFSYENNKRYELSSNSVSSLISPISNSNEYNIEMIIKNKHIGKVIGKGGDIIQQIRKDSGANIKILNKHFGKNRKIKIYGKFLDVKIAKEKINKSLL